MVYVACDICYTGIVHQKAQGVLRYLLGRMLSAHVSQSLVHMGRRRRSSLVHTSLSGVVHMGCTLCRAFLWLHCMLRFSLR